MGSLISREFSDRLLALSGLDCVVLLGAGADAGVLLRGLRAGKSPVIHPHHMLTDTFSDRRCAALQTIEDVSFILGWIDLLILYIFTFECLMTIMSK